MQSYAVNRMYYIVFAENVKRFLLKKALGSWVG